MTIKEVIIREAQPEDAEVILNYLNIVTKETNNLLITNKEINNISLNDEKNLLRGSLESTDSIFLIALQDGIVVGIGNLQSLTRKCHKHRATLALSVRKEFWRKGIGKKILNKLIAYGKSINLKMIELEVRTDNISAINLYKKIGFKEYGCYRNYRLIKDSYYNFSLMSIDISD